MNKPTTSATEIEEDKTKTNIELTLSYLVVCVALSYGIYFLLKKTNNWQPESFFVTNLNKNGLSSFHTDTYYGVTIILAMFYMFFRNLSLSKSKLLSWIGYIVLTLIGIAALIFIFPPFLGLVIEILRVGIPIAILAGAIFYIERNK